MLLPRIHSREARSELTAHWEVIRNGLVALGEVYSTEAGETLAAQIWGPLDDPIIKRKTQQLVMSKVKDILDSLRQDCDFHAPSTSDRDGRPPASSGIDHSVGSGGAPLAKTGDGPIKPNTDALRSSGPCAYPVPDPYPYPRHETRVTRHYE